MERARILHGKEAIALDHKFGNPHQHGEEVMIQRRWRGAQEFAPDLDRGAKPESRPRINPRGRYDIANASLVDAQYVTCISETYRDRRGEPTPDELHLRIGVDAIPERFEPRQLWKCGHVILCLRRLLCRFRGAPWQCIVTEQEC